MLLTLITHINQNNNHISFGTYNKQLYAALRKIETGAAKSAKEGDYDCFEHLIDDFATSRKSKDYKDAGNQGSKTLYAILTGMIDMLGEKLSEPVEHILGTFAEKFSILVSSKRQSTTTQSLLNQLAEKYRSLGGKNEKVLSALESRTDIHDIGKLVTEAIKTSNTEEIEKFLDTLSKEKKETSKVNNYFVNKFANHLGENINETNLPVCEKILNIFIDSLGDYTPTLKSKTHKILQELFNRYKAAGGKDKELFQKFNSLLLPGRKRIADNIIKNILQSSDLSELESFISGMMRTRRGYTVVNIQYLLKMFEAFTKYLDRDTVEQLEPAINLTFDKLSNLKLTSTGESGKFLYSLQKKYQEVGGKNNDLIKRMDLMLFGEGQKAFYTRLGRNIQYLFEKKDYKGIKEEIRRLPDIYRNEASLNSDKRLSYYNYYALIFDELNNSMNKQNLDEMEDIISELIKAAPTKRITSRQKPFYSIAKVLDKYEALGGSRTHSKALNQLIFGDGINAKINRIKYHLEQAFKESDIEKFEQELKNLRVINISRETSPEGQKSINQCRSFILTCIEDSLQKNDIHTAERLITGFFEASPDYRTIGFKNRFAAISQKYKECENPKEEIIKKLDQITYPVSVSKELSGIISAIEDASKNDQVTEFEDALKQFARIRSQHKGVKDTSSGIKTCMDLILSYIDKRANNGNLEETERLILLLSNSMKKRVLYKGSGLFNELESIKKHYLAAGGNNPRILIFFESVIKGEEVKLFRLSLKNALLNSDFTELEKTLPKIVAARKVSIGNPLNSRGLHKHIKKTVQSITDKDPNAIAPENIEKLITLLIDSLSDSVNNREIRVFDMLTYLYNLYRKAGGQNTQLSKNIFGLFQGEGIDKQLNKLRYIMTNAGSSSNAQKLEDAILELHILKNQYNLTRNEARNYARCINDMFKNLLILMDKKPVSEIEPVLETFFNLIKGLYFKSNSKNFGILKTLGEKYITKGGKNEAILKKFNTKILRITSIEEQTKRMEKALKAPNMELFKRQVTQISKLKNSNNFYLYYHPLLKTVAKNISPETLEQTKGALVHMQKVLNGYQFTKIGTTEKLLKRIKSAYVEAGGKDKVVLDILDNELKRIKFYIDEMYESNQGLVKKLFNEYKDLCRRDQHDDLWQQAKLGLLMAIRGNDGRGAFSTYAWASIKGQILDFFTHNQFFKISQEKYRNLKTVKEAVNSLLAEGEQPTANTVAELADLPVDEVKMLMNNPSRTSLDKQVGYNEDSAFLRDLLPEKRAKYLDKIVDLKDLAKSLKDILDDPNILGNRERDIIKRHFGLDEYQAMNLSEIGEVYGITRERVRQILERALKKIQNNPNVTKNIIGFLD